MKRYDVIIMSIDPLEDPEDNHQKYSLSVDAENEENAIKKAKERFSNSHKDYPIFWAKIA